MNCFKNIFKFKRLYCMPNSYAHDIKININVNLYLYKHIYVNISYIIKTNNFVIMFKLF